MSTFIHTFPKEFYQLDALTLSRHLLGQVLSHTTERGTTTGYIIETEAYMGGTDRASHAFGGVPTERTQVLYTGSGTAYVFMIYGMHYLFNVSCGPPNDPQCVLVRALEPLTGIEIMTSRRQTDERIKLTNGPGKLTQAMGINDAHYGLDLVDSNLKILQGRFVPDSLIVRGERINVDYAGDHALLPWRFWVNGSKYVSR